MALHRSKAATPEFYRQLGVQGRDWPPRAGLPELHPAVRNGAGEQGPVWCERDSPNAAAMTMQGRQGPSAAGLPQPHGPLAAAAG